MAEHIQTFQSEILELEKRLEAKKREMAAAGVEAPEKHIFKTVVKEHAGGPEAAQSTPNTSITPQSAGNQSSQLSPADEARIDELIEHAFMKGIPAAIELARKSNIPFLIDMLHDRLADEYYDKLIEARKLKAD